MKLSSQWLREFVDLTVDDHRLAEDLTSIGVAVEGISGEGASVIFEMEIGTNRPDAMNHYGVAREAAAFYGTALKAINASAAKPANSSGAGSGTTGVAPVQNTPSRDAAESKSSFTIDIEDAEGCARYTAQIVRCVKIKASPAHI